MQCRRTWHHPAWLDRIQPRIQHGRREGGRIPAVDLVRHAAGRQLRAASVRIRQGADSARLRADCPATGPYVLRSGRPCAAEYLQIRFGIYTLLRFVNVYCSNLCSVSPHNDTHTHTVGYIRRTDGLSGCFVGLAPKLAGTVLAVFGSESIAKRLGYGEIADERKSETLSDRE